MTPVVSSIPESILPAVKQIRDSEKYKKAGEKFQGFADEFINLMAQFLTAKPDKAKAAISYLNNFLRLETIEWGKQVAGLRQVVGKELSKMAAPTGTPLATASFPAPKVTKPATKGHHYAGCYAGDKLFDLCSHVPSNHLQATNFVLSNAADEMRPINNVHTRETRVNALITYLKTTWGEKFENCVGLSGSQKADVLKILRGEKV